MIVWAVLAGGRGTRFGEPKVSAVVDDRTFLDRCLDLIDTVRHQEDVVAVGVAHDQTVSTDRAVVVVKDRDIMPGPAHSIGRLAELAVSLNADLIFIAVDMLAVKGSTLNAIAHRIATNRGDSDPAVVVARKGDRVHWVLAGVPNELLDRIVSGGQSVNAVQSLLRLCKVDHLEVDEAELLDVNTKELLSAVPPIASCERP